MVKGGYAVSCSLLGWPGMALWVKQAVAVVGRAGPLQGSAWTCVFCGSRLVLELSLFLIFQMPFDLVILVPDLYRIGTQPSVLFLVTALNHGTLYGFTASFNWKYNDKICRPWGRWLKATVHSSCVVEWAHSGLSDSFFFSLPMESQDILGWRGHRKIIGSTHLLEAGPT